MVLQFACGRINKVHRIRSRRSSASTAFGTFEKRDGNFDYPTLELGVARSHEGTCSTRGNLQRNLQSGKGEKAQPSMRGSNKAQKLRSEYSSTQTTRLY